MEIPDTALHVVMVLFTGDSALQFCCSWREEVSSREPLPGEYVPLPETAQESAGWEKDCVAQVERTYLPGELPEWLRAALPVAPGPGCRGVVELRVLEPEVSEDGFVAIGAFDPADARRLLALLEEHEVPFEIEEDHSALLKTGREVSLYLGFQPQGSNLQVWVAATHLGRVRKLLRWLFPPEIPPPLVTGAAGSIPAASAFAEVYATPGSDVSKQSAGEYLPHLPDEPPP